MKSIFEDHKELVDKLVKDPETLLAEQTALKMDMMHMAIGIAGECTEVLKDVLESLGAAITQGGNALVYGPNIKKELGDIAFYVVHMKDLVGVDYRELACGPLDLVSQADIVAASQLAVDGGDLLDLVKKFTVYNEASPRGQEIKAKLEDLDRSLLRVCRMVGITYEEALEGNLQKLRARYGSTYSDASAKARADETALPGV
jgi:NTP pyrophosphatase (non-canonical NTP hydrolase)